MLRKIRFAWIRFQVGLKRSSSARIGSRLDEYGR